MRPLHWVGRRLARYPSAPRGGVNVASSRPGQLAHSLRKDDVLLVEDTSRFSSVIRTITQSNWSHSRAVRRRRTP